MNFFKLFLFILIEKSLSKDFCCFSSKNINDPCNSCWNNAKNYDYCGKSSLNCKLCNSNAVWCSDNHDTNFNPIKETKDWISGTWTTGYWDCCKPSCSWSKKGNMNKPVKSCSIIDNKILNEPDIKNVCDGGISASCSFYQPIIINETFSLGFAAASVSGLYGLEGDKNCGECYHIKFIDKIHDGIWGGSNPKLVNKEMVIQIINIGYDIIGEHSFDIQIPGAGQGFYQSGCIRQYKNKKVGDFDCDNPYGGCFDIKGCFRLPLDLQRGCFWRYNWYYWFKDNGKTNNPYIKFRKIKCPKQIIDISGSYSKNNSLDSIIIL